MTRRPNPRHTEHLINKTGSAPITRGGGHIQVRGEMSWTSHMPPAAFVRDYNQIIPTFGSDLHKEAMREMKHRRSCDSWLIKGGTLLALSGQLCAFLIVIAVLFVALVFGLLGYPGSAVCIVGIDLLGIVGAFLGRSYISQKGGVEEEAEFGPGADEDVEAEPPAEKAAG